MRAHINNVTIAEAPADQLVKIEGNWYFPPSSVSFDLLTPSPTPYVCPWKGECQYYTLDIDGQQYQDRAWAYPELRAGAVERVGTDFAGYVAFWKEVVVED
jgi:uncharacterized protein (DUF427 family)